MKNFKTKSIISMAVLGIFIGGLNTAFAKDLKDMPIIQEYTFTNYKIEDKTTFADIEVLKLNALKNKEFEKKLNDEFMAQGQKMYDDFNKQVEDLKANGVEGYIGVMSKYDVKADSQDVLSIVLNQYNLWSCIKRSERGKTQIYK